MNERQFAKLVNKSPYLFWKMKDNCDRWLLIKER